MSRVEPPLPELVDMRTGHRVVVLEDVFVNWRVPSAELERELQRRRRKGLPLDIPAETIGRVVDVAERGMAVVAEAAEDLGVDSRVRVRLGTASATVRIAHWWDLPEAGWRLFGTEVVDADERFREHLAWWHARERSAAESEHLPEQDIDWVTDDLIWYFVDVFGERLEPEELIARRAASVAGEAPGPTGAVEDAGTDAAGPEDDEDRSEPAPVECAEQVAEKDPTADSDRERPTGRRRRR
jgi:hypothetical protein